MMDLEAKKAEIVIIKGIKKRWSLCCLNGFVSTVSECVCVCVCVCEREREREREYIIRGIKYKHKGVRLY